MFIRNSGKVNFRSWREPSVSDPPHPPPRARPSAFLSHLAEMEVEETWKWSFSRPSRSPAHYARLLLDQWDHAKGYPLLCIIRFCFCACDCWNLSQSVYWMFRHEGPDRHHPWLNRRLDFYPHVYSISSSECTMRCVAREPNSSYRKKSWLWPGRSWGASGRV